MADEMTIQSVRCEAAKKRFYDSLRWWNLYTVLLFIFSIALIGFLIYVIVFLIKQDIVQSILGTLGTIVDGVALKWVVERRKDVYEELKEAQQWIDANCPNLMESIDTKKFGFMGKLP